MCYSNSYHCYDGAKLQYFYRPAKEMIRKHAFSAQMVPICAELQSISISSVISNIFLTCFFSHIFPHGFFSNCTVEIWDSDNGNRE